MAKFRTWLEGLINEQPHTTFVGQIPPELAFLHGRFVDLGFENLSLNVHELESLGKAFTESGVIVPGTRWRLREISGKTVVEKIDGTEQATLPSHWKQGVLVTDVNFNPTWLGKRLRRDQIGAYDLSNFRDVGDGLVPP